MKILTLLMAVVGMQVAAFAGPGQEATVLTVNIPLRITISSNGTTALVTAPTTTTPAAEQNTQPETAVTQEVQTEPQVVFQPVRRAYLASTPRYVSPRLMVRTPRVCGPRYVVRRAACYPTYCEPGWSVHGGFGFGRRNHFSLGFFGSF